MRIFFCKCDRRNLPCDGADAPAFDSDDSILLGGAGCREELDFRGADSFRSSGSILEQGAPGAVRASRRRGCRESASPRGARRGRAGWPRHTDGARPGTPALADQTDDGQKLRGAERQRSRGEAKSAGRAAPRMGGQRLDCEFVTRDVSGRHQLDPPPSNPPPPSERWRSHCAAGAEGSRPVLGAGHPAPRRSVGLSEPRAVLQQRTEGRSVPGEPTVSVYCSGLKIRTEFSYHFSLPSRRGHIGLNPEQTTRLSSLRI